MNPFKSLIRRVDREWRRARNKLGSFPALATKLLTEFEYDLHQEQLDQCLAAWFLKSSTLPEQVSLHNTFGQPPITLYNNGEVVVDLYLWLTCDTAIHSHGFRGAFRVLHGKSLHETFKVKVAQRIGPGVMVCDPGTPDLAILDPGDVRTILVGEKLTHRVIHLEHPTVTLCVKTINEPGIYQWEYHPDGLAIQRRHVDQGLVKELYYFQYLLGQNAGLAGRFLEELFAGLSVVTRMNLYEEISGGSYDLSEDAVEQCLAEIRDLADGAAWFRNYESAAPPYLKELYVQGCETALGRLVAHFINCGHDLETMRPHLTRVAGGRLTRDDARSVAIALMDVEPIFGCELEMEDRATIKSLLANPTKKIPTSLKPFGQIPRMRDFIRMFPASGATGR
jgi:hypothetical protein